MLTFLVLPSGRKKGIKRFCSVTNLFQRLGVVFSNRSHIRAKLESNNLHIRAH